MKKYNNTSAFMGYTIGFKWNGIWYYRYNPCVIYFRHKLFYYNYNYDTIINI